MNSNEQTPGRRVRLAPACGALLVLAVGTAFRADAQAAGAATPAAARSAAPASALPQEPPGALSRANLTKKRPRPPFDMTGNWMWDGKRNRASGAYQFLPLPKFKPAVQAEYDEAMRTIASGRPYKNDEGNCWPAGMPESMTRVWPNQTIQLPTMIVMTQMLKHEIRWIYIDGRPHADPDIKPASYSGDSIGHFEGDTLVVETTNLQPKHHWIQNGVPAGEKLRIVERIRLIDRGNTLEDTFTMTDPDMWEGEWTSTKYWYRHDDVDAEEAFCLPDINDNLLSTH